MTEKWYTDMAAKTARIDERTENIQNDLKAGEKRFEAIEKRMSTCEEKQNAHDFQLRLTKWAAGIATGLGMTALGHWINNKH